MQRAKRGGANAAETVRSVAARVRRVQSDVGARQRAAIIKVAGTARAGFEVRLAELKAEVERVLEPYDRDGMPPPLLRLSGRSSEEKPYNRYLGWLLDPSRGHGAALPALRALARHLRFEALLTELQRTPEDVEVRCEQPWPAGSGSTKEPDLLVLVPKGQPRAMLLIENKVYADESGDQYGPYLHALARLAKHHDLMAAHAAYLLSPDERECPAGWTGAMRHHALASVLASVARDPSVPSWGRMMCFLVADAFLHDASAAERVRELRVFRDRQRVGERPSVHHVARIAELLRLPHPFIWRHDDPLG